jgi:hypothetical protein
MRWSAALILMLMAHDVALGQAFDERFGSPEEAPPSQQGSLTVTGLLRQGFDVVGTYMSGARGIVFLKKGSFLYSCEVAAAGQPISALKTVNCVPVQ